MTPYIGSIERAGIAVAQPPDATDLHATAASFSCSHVVWRMRSLQIRGFAPVWSAYDFSERCSGWETGTGPVRGVVNRTTSDEDIGKLINNRQNGRRRGRGGGGSGAPRPNGGSGGQDRGNRIDNRARGNAAQLHEKYKALARDAQMQGDRVNTEYYLQFADHYFRVLAESRSRFEEQQPRPRRDDFSQSDEDYGDEGDRLANEDQGGSDQVYASEQDRQRDYEPREARSDNRERAERMERADRGDGRAENRERIERTESRVGNRREDQPRRPRRESAPRYEEQPEPQPSAPAEEPDGNVAVAETPAPARRRGRPPRAAAPQANAERIDMDVLPPSFSLAAPVNDAGDAEVVEKPRRRTRKPRGEEAAA